MENISRKLPDPISMEKKDIVELLLREEYGRLPSAPYSVTAELEKAEALGITLKGIIFA